MSSLVVGLVVQIQGPIPQKRLLLMRPNQATYCLSRPDGAQSVSYCPSAAGQGRLEKSDSVFHLYHHFERVEEDTLKPSSYLLLACLNRNFDKQRDFCVSLAVQRLP